MSNLLAVNAKVSNLVFFEMSCNYLGLWPQVKGYDPFNLLLVTYISVEVGHIQLQTM